MQEKANVCNYLVSTPEPRQQSRLCHINMLKLIWTGSLSHCLLLGREKLFCCCPSLKSLIRLGNTEALSSEDLAKSQPSSTVTDVDDVFSPFSAVVHERLKKSEMSSKLDSCFFHLTQSRARMWSVR